MATAAASAAGSAEAAKYPAAKKAYESALTAYNKKKDEWMTLALGEARILAVETDLKTVYADKKTETDKITTGVNTEKSAYDGAVKAANDKKILWDKAIKAETQHKDLINRLTRNLKTATAQTKPTKTVV